MNLAAWELGESIDCSRVIAPALVYVGSEDDPDGDRRTAEAIGGTFRALPGLNHLTAFTEIDHVMPLVFEFLGSAGG
jgi:hypothetical protein